MRLYLSSDRLGNRTDELVRMVGANKRVALLANACDYRTDEVRRERVQRDKGELTALGLLPTEIDLRDYFGGLFTREKLADFGFVWVRGGNVFNLRKAMAYSGFDAVIADMLKTDEIVYGGFSAGACVLAPTLRGIELCDDPNQIPEGYQKDIIWDGLSLVPYSIAPHYKSDHPETERIDRVVDYFKEHHMPYKALHDGEVIVVDEEKS